MPDNTQYVKATWLEANKLKNAITDVFFIFLVTAVVIASLFMQSIDPATNWFMRSGAIVVLVGAVMEYRHNEFQHSIDTTSIKWASGMGAPVIFQPSHLRKALGYIAHIFVVVGTFIAAYGDLILSLH
jgi:hypothetical protein